MAQIKFNIFRGSGLSSKAIAVYCLAAIQLQSDEEVGKLLTPEDLYFLLEGKVTIPYKKKQRLVSGIKELYGAGVFSGKEVAPNKYVVNSFKGEGGLFVDLSYKTLLKIYKAGGGKWTNLLYLYLVIVSTINFRSKVGQYSVAWFAEETQISAKTIFAYFKILEECELLYVYRPHVYKVTNCYALYENKECAINVGVTKIKMQKALDKVN